MAASTDLTGNAALGGDWVLEAASGAVEASGLHAASFAGLLDLTVSPLTYSYPGHSGGEYRNDDAFAALRADGSVVTWGDSSYGGDSSAVASQIDGSIDVTQVFSTSYAFAALRADGSVVTWGDSYYGGDSSAVASQLDGSIDVTQVFSTAVCLCRAARRRLGGDLGGLVLWRRQQRRGQPDRWQHRRDAGVFDGGCLCRAARRRLGGDLGILCCGGDSSAVASQLDGSIDVTQVFSTGSAFAALRADGSVVTWGSSAYGGDSSAVASQIDGTHRRDAGVFDGICLCRAARRRLGGDLGGLDRWRRQQRRGQPDSMARIDVTQVFSTRVPLPRCAPTARW